MNKQEIIKNIEELNDNSKYNEAAHYIAQVFNLKMEVEFLHNVNDGNGSGWSTYLNDVNFTFKLDPKKFFIEKAHHYNWTYDIARMCRDWAECTNIEYK